MNSEQARFWAWDPPKTAMLNLFIEGARARLWAPSQIGLAKPGWVWWELEIWELMNQVRVFPDTLVRRSCLDHFHCQDIKIIALLSPLSQKYRILIRKVCEFRDGGYGNPNEDITHPIPRVCSFSRQRTSLVNHQAVDSYKVQSCISQRLFRCLLLASGM
jgi:hypothetical protein